MSTKVAAPGEEEWYRVYKPGLDTAAFDPLDPEKRYHEGILVETKPGYGKGTLFHVTGDIIAASGMRYEEREFDREMESEYLHNFPQIGLVSRADFHSGKVGAILKELPRPTKQQVDPTTGRHEIIWTKQDGERYGPDEQRRPIFKCNEWTRQYAIPALREAGVLLDFP
ncbi:hypothetical protein TEQG_07879 [Trichophyton equinum CBS 127.97]|uniref:Uncharacterized protein n=1 Tax=Trichophyton equinum (strain ATCC MYA-4606 / CBS 127.97) TaxID=559882 RepID=F2Q456_TRIEC|nr:hypothetical protein TEQG_07879 [Trichophyton equinum CBS 127.97]